MSDTCDHGLPSYCCAICNRCVLDRSVTARRRKEDDETPYYGSGSVAMQCASRNAPTLHEPCESTDKTLRPLYTGK